MLTLNLEGEESSRRDGEQAVGVLLSEAETSSGIISKTDPLDEYGI